MKLKSLPDRLTLLRGFHSCESNLFVFSSLKDLESICPDTSCCRGERAHGGRASSYRACAESSTAGRPGRRDGASTFLLLRRLDRTPCRSRGGRDIGQCNTEQYGRLVVFTAAIKIFVACLCCLLTLKCWTHFDFSCKLTSKWPPWTLNVSAV